MNGMMPQPLRPSQEPKFSAIGPGYRTSSREIDATKRGSKTVILIAAAVLAPILIWLLFHLLYSGVQ